MLQTFALALTLSLEIPIILWMLKSDPETEPMSKWLKTFLVATPTLIMHPFLWLASRDWLAHIPYGPRIVMLELMVVAVEGILLAMILRISWLGAQKISFVANATSCLAGLLLWSLSPYFTRSL